MSVKLNIYSNFISSIPEDIKNNPGRTVAVALIAIGFLVVLLTGAVGPHIPNIGTTIAGNVANILLYTGSAALGVYLIALVSVYAYLKCKTPPSKEETPTPLKEENTVQPQFILSVPPPPLTATSPQTQENTTWAPLEDIKSAYPVFFSERLLTEIKNSLPDLDQVKDAPRRTKREYEAALKEAYRGLLLNQTISLSFGKNLLPITVNECPILAAHSAQTFIIECLYLLNSSPDLDTDLKVNVTDFLKEFSDLEEEVKERFKEKLLLLPAAIEQEFRNPESPDLVFGLKKNIEDFITSLMTTYNSQFSEDVIDTQEHLKKLSHLFSYIEAWESAEIVHSAISLDDFWKSLREQNIDIPQLTEYKKIYYSIRLTFGNDPDAFTVIDRDPI